MAAHRLTLESVLSQLVPDPTTGCLLWPKPLARNGYARVGKHRVGLHVFVWEALHGPIPPGMEVDHVYARGCRFRHCGNPDHLELVTRAENNARRVFVKVEKCKRGHEFTVENTRIRKNGTRYCRECHRVRREEARMRLRKET